MRLASRSSQKRLGMTALPGNRNKSKTTLNFGELPTNRETFEMLARNFAVAVVLQLAATTAAWALPIADFTSSATEDDISIYSPSFSFVSQKDGSASNAGAAVSAADNRSDQFGTRVGTAAASLPSGPLQDGRSGLHLA